jgi:hypothetical protein
VRAFCDPVRTIDDPSGEQTVTAGNQAFMARFGERGDE